MSISLTAGITGVKSADMVVYIQERGTGIETEFDGTSVTVADLATHISTFSLQELGELEKQSVTFGSEPNETVDGNNVGQIVLTKNYNFETTLINVLNANITSLESLDGKSVDVLIVEKDSGSLERKYFALYNVIYNYQESFQSGQYQRLPFSITKSVQKESEIRKIGLITSS